MYGRGNYKYLLVMLKEMHDNHIIHKSAKSGFLRRDEWNYALTFQEGFVSFSVVMLNQVRTCSCFFLAK